MCSPLHLRPFYVLRVPAPNRVHVSPPPTTTTTPPQPTPATPHHPSFTPKIDPFWGVLGYFLQPCAEVIAEQHRRCCTFVSSVINYGALRFVCTIPQPPTLNIGKFPLFLARFTPFVVYNTIYKWGGVGCCGVAPGRPVAGLSYSQHCRGVGVGVGGEARQQWVRLIVNCGCGVKTYLGTGDVVHVPLVPSARLLPRAKGPFYLFRVLFWGQFLTVPISRAEKI